MKSRKSYSKIGVGMLLAVFGVCMGGLAVAAQGDVRITFYCSPDSLGTALEQAFEAEHGDVLDYIGGPWCRKLKAEQETGNIVADVIYGAEPIFYEELMLDSALLEYASPEEVNLVDKYQWDTSYYTIADLRYIGIIYNKNLVADTWLPTSIEGLSDGLWYQMTTVADATQCSSALAMAGAMVYPDFDFSFFEEANANGALLADRAGKLPSLVASGEAALGLGPHDAVVRLQNKAKKEGTESPVTIAWPEDGVYVIPRPVAIIADETRSADATTLAEAFVDFILSDVGQKLAVQKGGYVPARAGVSSPGLVPDDLDLIETDWDWVMENNEAIRDRFTHIMYGN
jgi:iron(III) transport system substrate-binding protein